jgi:hypothetical protein
MNKKSREEKKKWPCGCEYTKLGGFFILRLYFFLASAGPVVLLSAEMRIISAVAAGYWTLPLLLLLIIIAQLHSCCKTVATVFHQSFLNLYVGVTRLVK